MRLIICISLFFLFGCSDMDISTEVYYVIKHPDTVRAVRTFSTYDGQDGDTLSPPPPPPHPSIFYGHHNFILLDKRVFYHNNYIWHRCGTGIDWTKPPRLYLTADSLTEINDDELLQFLTINIPDSMTNHERTVASISSPKDTIKSNSFKVITDYFKSKNIKQYNIRSWTEEEQFSLTSKLESKNYNPKTATFKTGFDEDLYGFEKLK